MTNSTPRNSTPRIGAAVKSVSAVVSPLIDSPAVAGATMKMATPTVLNPGPRPRGPIEPTAQGNTSKKDDKKGSKNDDKKGPGKDDKKGPGKDDKKGPGQSKGPTSMSR